MDFVPTAEGYVKVTAVKGGRSFNYVYIYKDHLGNNRLSYTVDLADGVLKIMSENQYYPFGLRHNGYSSTEQILNPLDTPPYVQLVPYMPAQPVVGEVGGYKYKYNGKELQDELGLNVYDYGARNYDPAIGRWFNIDPLAETSRRWSPYAYCYNNPMSFVDPDGMEADDWRINYTDKNGKQQQFVFNGGATALPDNQFVRDFVDAYRYDVGNGGGDGLRSVAENPALMIDVQETSGPSFTDQPSSSPGSGDYNVLNWNPKMGLETTNGVVLSPATILDHEADHAGKYAAAGKASMNSRAETSDKKYDNKEEKRVITGSEQRTARANGELAPGQVTRTDHKGLPVITISPTSTKVDAAKTVKFNEKLNSQGLYSTPSVEKYRKN